jgi:hypothetical protein
MQCPSCGRESSGKFCPECGVPLAGAGCRACGAALDAGARFCARCGAPATAGATAPVAGRNGRNTAWYVAAGVLVVLIIVILVPMLSNGSQPPVEAPFAGGSATGGSPAPLSDNMRENADRLFNRIMEARESGNTAQATQFYPMAIQAYQASEPLDADGLYHLSLIQTAAGDPGAARATAERILDMAPNHLLALGAAGEAMLELGDTAAARTYYARFLDNYESERTRELVEYMDHTRILPAYEQQARALTTP